MKPTGVLTAGGFARRASALRHCKHSGQLLQVVRGAALCSAARRQLAAGVRLSSGGLIGHAKRASAVCRPRAQRAVLRPLSPSSFSYCVMVLFLAPGASLIKRHFQGRKCWAASRDGLCWGLPILLASGNCWAGVQAFMPVEQIIEHNLGQLFGGAIIKVHRPWLRGGMLRGGIAWQISVVVMPTLPAASLWFAFARWRGEAGELPGGTTSRHAQRRASRRPGGRRRCTPSG